MSEHHARQAIDDESLYDTKAAAAYIGFGHNTLRNARSTGRLAGVTPPQHVCIGSKRLYLGSTLREWRQQFLPSADRVA